MYVRFNYSLIVYKFGLHNDKDPNNNQFLKQKKRWRKNVFEYFGLKNWLIRIFAQILNESSFLIFRCCFCKFAKQKCSTYDYDSNISSLVERMFTVEDVIKIVAVWTSHW